MRATGEVRHSAGGADARGGDKMKFNNFYELTPNTSHKSFYGKAKVLIGENNTEYLLSYDTIVMSRNNGKLRRHWAGWSATTGRHINAFCGINKKEYDKLEVIAMEF